MIEGVIEAGPPLSENAWLRFVSSIARLSQLRLPSSSFAVVYLAWKVDTLAAEQIYLQDPQAAIFHPSSS